MKITGSQRAILGFVSLPFYLGFCCHLKKKVWNTSFLSVFNVFHILTQKTTTISYKEIYEDKKMEAEDIMIWI